MALTFAVDGAGVVIQLKSSSAGVVLDNAGPGTVFVRANATRAHTFDTAVLSGGSLSFERAPAFIALTSKRRAVVTLGSDGAACNTL